MLGLYWGYIRVIVGLYWACIGIMEDEMETAIPSPRFSRAASAVEFAVPVKVTTPH